MSLIYSVIYLTDLLKIAILTLPSRQLHQGSVVVVGSGVVVVATVVVVVVVVVGGGGGGGGQLSSDTQVFVP